MGFGINWPDWSDRFDALGSHLPREFREIIGDHPTASALKLVSFCLLSIPFFSLVGSPSLFNQNALLASGAALYVVSLYLSKPGFSLEQEVNISLVGGLFGFALQTFFSPPEGMRIYDFFYIFTGTVALIASWNNRGKSLGKLAAITALCLGTSLVSFNLLGDVFANPDFANNSVIVGLAISLASFAYLGIYPSDADRTVIKSLQIFVFGTTIGCWNLLMISEQADFGGTASTLVGWRMSGVWGGLHVLLAALFSVAILWDRENRQDHENPETGVMARILASTPIPLFAFMIAAFVFLPGIFDSVEPKKHVGPTLGLFNVLASRFLEFGFLSQCSSSHLILGNEAWAYTGCWVYPTMWTNPMLWPLVTVRYLGLNPLVSARLIVFLGQFLIIWLLGSVVNSWYGKIPAFASILAYATSLQVLHYGEIYAPQISMTLWCLLLIKLWTPILKGNEATNWQSTALVAFTISGPLAMGPTPTVFSMAFFSICAYFFLELRSSMLKHLSIATVTGFSSLMIWSKVIDYYWENQGGSETMLFEKAQHRSQSASFLADFDFYLIMIERSGWLLNVLVLCGLILLAINAYRIANKGDCSSNPAFGALIIAAPFIALQVQFSVMFPQSITDHDYLNVIWLLIPGSVGFGVYSSGRYDITNFAVLLLGLLLISHDLAGLSSRIEGNHEPQYHELQGWMYNNIDQDETVLMSGDLYQWHLIQVLAGESILVRPIDDSSDFPIIWLEDPGYDLIIVNENAVESWSLFAEPSVLEDWCTELTTNFAATEEYQVSESFIVMRKC
jgi:hypothetical protein